MLEKRIEISQIEVTQNNCVQVRTSTLIIEDGKEISKTYSRHCVVPGDDYSAEDSKVKAVCLAVHTVATVAEYQAQAAYQTR